MDIMLLAPNANIKIATKQLEIISSIFKDSGYEGDINIVTRYSDKTEVAIIIYSAK